MAPRPLLAQSRHPEKRNRCRYWGKADMTFAAWMSKADIAEKKPDTITLWSIRALTELLFRGAADIALRYNKRLRCRRSQPPRGRRTLPPTTRNVSLESPIRLVPSPTNFLYVGRNT